MSGVEVFGLLLGVFPLIISAAEHYECARRLAKSEHEYRKTINDVKDEQLFFRLILQELLLPLTTNDESDDEFIENLIMDPDGAEWREDGVQAALKERLGQTYDRFMEISKLLHTRLSKLLFSLVNNNPQLQEKIKANPSGAYQNAPTTKRKLAAAAFHQYLKQQFQYRKEQLKFGLGKFEREEVLNEVHECNEKLEKLLQKSDRIITFQKSKIAAVSPKAAQALVQYAHQADRIYALIHHSWGCQCKNKHCAYLWLQHRTSPKFELKLLVLWGPVVPSGSSFPPWDRQGLQIISTASQPARLGPPRVESGSSKALPVIVPPCAGPRGPKKRRVDAEGASSYEGVSRLSPMIAGIEAENDKDIQHAGQSKEKADMQAEISRLCVAISRCGMEVSCIGALSDHAGGRKYSVFSQPEQNFATGEITLQDALHSSKQRLKRADRFRIALAVASSHLQLHSTRWARKQWEAADIRFPKCTGVDGSIMFDKPYVSADFNAALSDQEKVPKKSDRSFACLGIMLLELLFGACLEDHDLWEELGFQQNKSKPPFRLIVARQWADLVEGEAGPDFSAAVMWCLNESPTTLEGEQWRKDLAGRVVLPLQNCCDWIQGKPVALV